MVRGDGLPVNDQPDGQRMVRSHRLTAGWSEEGQVTQTDSAQ